MATKDHAGFCLNEDDSNFCYSFPESEMTVAGLERQAQFYGHGQVKRMVWNTNAQRTMSESKVIDSFWTGVEFREDGTAWFKGRQLATETARFILNARRLAERGIDAFKVWLEATRKCGREAWLSMRMNDVHCVHDAGSFMHDAFWREHPEYRVAPYNEQDMLSYQLDFGIQAVRDYKLAYVAEMLSKYDLDGLELDWSRFPMHLRAGFELVDAHCITEFIRAVRRLAVLASERLGHGIKLGVRIPSRPELARRAGFDFMAWRRENLVDSVTVTNFWPTTDSDMPLELWRELLGENIELCAGLEIMAQSDPNTVYTWTSAEIATGYACQYLYRGADKIYLFNYMRGFTGMRDDAAMTRFLDAAGDMATANDLRRRHVVSYCTAWNVPSDIASILPLEIDERSYRQIRLNVGGGTADRRATILLAFQDGEANLPLHIRLNGTECTEIAVGGRPLLPPLVRNLRRFEIPAGALHDGENVIQVRGAEGVRATVRWAEIQIN